MFLQGTVLEPHVSLSGHALVTSVRLDTPMPRPHGASGRGSSRSPVGYDILINDIPRSPTGQNKTADNVWRGGEPASPLSMRRHEMRRRFPLVL